MNPTIANHTTPRPNYRIYDRTGGCVTHDIYAETLEEAIEIGREWIEEGDWEPSTHATSLDCVIREIVYVRVIDGEYTRPDGTVYTIDEDGDLYSETEGALYSGRKLAHDGDIDTGATDAGDEYDCSGLAPVIQPPDCTEGHEHEWESPYSVVGGYKESPGVWGSGHGQVRITDVCKHCGIYRTIDYGATNPSNGLRCTSIVYPEADEASLNFVWGDEAEWTEWVKNHIDEDEMDDDDLTAAFRAIFRREPDEQERAEGLWSHLCAAVNA